MANKFNQNLQTSVQYLVELIGKVNELKSTSAGMGSVTTKSLIDVEKQMRKAKDVGALTAKEFYNIQNAMFKYIDTNEDMNKVIDLTVEGLGKLTSKQVELRKSNEALAKSENDVAKATRERLKEADRIYSNQQSLLNQKKKALSAIEKEANAEKKAIEDKRKARLKEADEIYRNKQSLKSQRDKTIAGIERERIAELKAIESKRVARLNEADRIYSNKQALARQKAQAIAETKREAAAVVKAEEQKRAARLREADQIEKNKQALARQKAAALEALRPYKQLVAQYEKARRNLQDLTVKHGAHSLKVKKAREEYRKLGKQIQEANGKMSNAKKSFTGLGRGVSSLLGAFGIMGGMQIFANLVTNSFKLVKTFDSLGFAMENISDGALELANNQAFLSQMVDDFGVNLVQTTERYTKFLAAAKQSGLTVREAENIFRSMTKTSAVLGLKTDEMRGVFLALEQMLSKGKITTEELRRQLGERLPGAVGIMAKSMGVSIEKLDEMMKKGEIISHEVLPNFAKAVEVAFGIQSVEHVDTLTAASTRLTSAWQVFVKTIAGDAGWLRDVFNWLADAVNTVAFEMMSTEERIQANLGANKKEQGSILRDSAIVDVENSEKAYGSYKKLVKLMADTKAKADRSSGEEKLRLDAEYDAHMEEVLKWEDKIEARSKEIAKEGLADAEAQLQKEKALLKLKEDELAAAEKYNDELDWTDKLNGKATAHLKEERDSLRESVSSAKAKMLLYRGFTEVGTSTTPEKDDDGGSRSARPRAIKDYSLNDDIEALKQVVELTEQRLKAEEETYEAKRGYAKNILEDEKAINDLTSIQKIKNLEISYKKDFELAIKNKERTAELEQEKANKIAGIKAEARTADIKAESDYQKKLDKIDADELKKSTKQIELLRKNSEIERTKELAELEKSGLKGEALKKAQEEVNQKYFNLEKEALIELIQYWIKYYEARGIAVDGLKTLLAEVQASFFKSKGGDDEVFDFEKIMNLAQEALGEIWNLHDALHNRRMEQIEAEIDAETDKYDKLIALAENDATQKANLEAEKARALEKLEEERLRIEQKKAKNDKAMALFEIALNTAVAISAYLTQPWMIAFAATMGALQAATVLAQPIPQYKDGLENADKDHIAMINDGGKQEYIERDGKILTTSIKNAIVPIKKGDTVHKDYESLTKKTMLISALAGGKILQESGYNELESILESGLEKGFKKAKVNNKLILKGFDYGKQAYKEKLKRW